MTPPRLVGQLQLPRAGFELAVSITLNLDRPTGLFGPSGSGKTSLLRCLCGLEPMGTGRVCLDGQVLQDKGFSLPAWRRGIAMVFQDPLLFDHRNVAGNLALALRQPSANGGIRLDAVVQLLDLEGLLARPVAQLSGGEKRRVAIAQALLSQPRLLLLDEPLSGLDEVVAMRLATRLKDCFATLKLPVIMVSHRLDELLRITGHLLVLEAGQITASGTTGELAADLALPLAHAGDARVVLYGTVVSHDTRYHLANVQLDQHVLQLPDIAAPVGARLAVVVAARDVSLARQPPASSSILNILPARVHSLAPAGDILTTVRLESDGQVLLARITRKSADALALRPGDSVWAQIKSAVLSD